MKFKSRKVVAIITAIVLMTLVSFQSVYGMEQAPAETVTAKQVQETDISLEQEAASAAGEEIDAAQEESGAETKPEENAEASPDHAENAVSEETVDTAPEEGNSDETKPEETAETSPENGEKTVSEDMEESAPEEDANTASETGMESALEESEDALCEEDGDVSEAEADAEINETDAADGSFSEPEGEMETGTVKCAFQFGDLPIVEDYEENDGNGGSETEFLLKQINGTRSEINSYLYEKLSNREETIDISSYKVDSEELGYIIGGVLNDHPDLYFVEKNFSFEVADESVGTLKPVYADTDDAQFNRYVNMALKVLRTGMTDFEKALALHDYIVLNCEYDYSNYLHGTIPADSYSAYGVLVNQKAVCNGYALAYQYLLQKANISCYMVVSSDMNHAWNLVKLGGHYYHADTTWDDPVDDLFGRVRHFYMFRSDSAFTKTCGHYGWTVYGNPNAKATDSRYDNAFWTDSFFDSQLVPYEHFLYFIDHGSKSIKRVYFYGMESEPEIVCNRLGLWKGTGGYYTYSGLFEYGGKLYFNRQDAILSIDLEKENAKPIKRFSIDPNKENGIIFKIVYGRDKVYYRISTNRDVSKKKEIFKAKIDLSEKNPVGEALVDFEYGYSGGNVYINNYYGDTADVVVPTEIDGYHVVNIAEDTFVNAEKMETLTISEGITAMAAKSVRDCPALREIRLPSTVKFDYIMDDIFPGCTGLEKITVADGNENYCAIDGVLYSISDKEPSALLCYPCASKREVFSIPEGVRNIYGSNTLDGASMKELIIPVSMYKISSNLNNIQNLESIKVDEKNFYLHTEDGVLYDKKETVLLSCPAAKKGKLNVPDSVIGVETSAVKNCSLSGIAFSGYVTIGGDNFVKCPDGFTIYAPEDSGAADYAKKRGIKFVASGTIPEESIIEAGTYVASDLTWSISSNGILTISGNGEVKEIAPYTFTRQKNYIRKIVFEEGVTGLGVRSFQLLENVVCVSLPDTLKKIDDDAFSGCTRLEDITLPEGLTYLGPKAFDGTGITSINIPASLTDFDGSAFSVADSLEEITVADNHPNFCSVDGVLYSKDKRKLVRMPSGKKVSSYTVSSTVECLGKSAFEGCSWLKELEINKSVTEFSEKVFSSCENLKNIYYTGSESKWKEITKGINCDIPYGCTVNYNVGKMLTVSFNLGGYGKAIDSVEVRKGGFVSRPEDPKDREMLFAGWYEDPNHVKKWVFETDKVYYNVVLHARWISTDLANDRDDSGGYSDAERQKKDLEKLGAWVVTGKAKTFNGKPVYPKVTVKYKSGKKTVTLKEGAHFRVYYDQRINAGKGRVTVRGSGPYSGEITGSYFIKSKSLKSLKVICGSMVKGSSQSIPVFVYDGTRLLRNNVDYVLNKKPADIAKKTGSKSVTVKGIGNYSGSKKASVTVYKAGAGLDTAGYSVQLTPPSDNPSMEFSGKSVKPQVSVVSDIDGAALDSSAYSVKYINNKNAGTAFVKVTGKGKLRGTLIGTFTIKSASVDFELGNNGMIPDQTYSGKLIKPSIKVMADGKKLKLGKDYTVTYRNNFYVTSGSFRASVRVQGIGNYADSPSKDFYFNINPEK